ncbi:MAG: hypothetical protein K6L75_08605 [Cellvibrionaceae bacterium]
MTSEQRRLYYLQAMGIDGYYPRYQLPGAAVPVACEHIFDKEFEFLADSVVAGAPLLQQAEKQVSPITSQKETIAQEGVASIKERSKIANDIAQDLVAVKNRREKSNGMPLLAESDSEKYAERNSNVKVNNFNLCVWRISDDLIIIDTNQPHLALPTEKLLFNIVRALGYSLTELPRSTQLRWPSVGRASSPDEDSARGMIEAFLIAENNKKSFSKMLLMGNNAAKYVLPAKNRKDEGGSAVNTFNFNALVSHSFDVSTADISAKAIVVPSLTVLLQKPKFKSITWQSIQSFRL